MNHEKDKIREFTDLTVWKEAHKLVLFVYTETKGFPREEIFALTSQMRRSAVSVTSNIAEGVGRQSFKEKIQFYYLAHGSLVELRNQLYIARDVLYTKSENFEKIHEQTIRVQ